MTVPSAAGAGSGTGPGPLAGIRVVELGGIGPVPFAAMVLAELGADVVRVDRPEETNPLVLAGGLRRSRPSIAVDLKHDDGRAVVQRLVDDADVVLEGWRPGVAERLGLGPDECLARNPRLVHARMTGWGQTGPWAQRAGHDLTYAAVSGSLHALGPAGRPVVPVPPVADFAGGSMYLVTGVLAALLSRATTGRGQVVDAAMVEGAAHLASLVHGLLGEGGWTDARAANLLDGGAPFYDVYECADGRFVAVGALEPQFWAALVAGLGVEVEGDAARPGDLAGAARGVHGGLPRAVARRVGRALRRAPTPAWPPCSRSPRRPTTRTWRRAGPSPPGPPGHPCRARRRGSRGRRRSTRGRCRCPVPTRPRGCCAPGSPRPRSPPSSRPAPSTRPDRLHSMPRPLMSRPCVSVVPLESVGGRTASGWAVGFDGGMSETTPSQPADAATSGPVARVRVEVEGPVARIVLDAPHRLNAVDPAMCADVVAAVRRLDDDPAVRVIVLTGEGRGFCSGAPLSATGADMGVLDAGAEVVRTLLAARTPTVALVHGVAAGIGVPHGARLRLRARGRRGAVRPRVHEDRADAGRWVDGARHRLDRARAGPAPRDDRGAPRRADRGRRGAWSPRASPPTGSPPAPPRSSTASRPAATLALAETTAAVNAACPDVEAALAREDAGQRGSGHDGPPRGRRGLPRQAPPGVPRPLRPTARSCALTAVRDGVQGTSCAGHPEAAVGAARASRSERSHQCGPVGP